MLADNAPTGQHSLFLESWGAYLTVVTYKGHQFFVIAQVCTLLGIKTDGQVETLRERELMEGLVLKLPIQTSRGIREAWCIDIEAVGAWMLIISDRRVRVESRPNLLKLQRDIMQAARQVMFGIVDDHPLRQELNDTRQFVWFLERQIVDMQQQQRLLLPESDEDEGGI